MSRENPASIRTVAVVGASGIGKHHANWWNLNGVRVCAFVGTSVGSVMQTAAMLRELIGFDGKGYLDVEQMLREQKPDVLDVCSPPSNHAAQVRAGLQNGAHVLCEKPFLYADRQNPSKQLAETDRLLEMAASAGLQLALCSQHILTAASCLRQYREQNGEERISRMEAVLASPLRHEPDSGERVWIDMGPHLLAAAQAVDPRAELLPETIAVSFKTNDVRCRFSLKTIDGQALECDCHAFRTTGEPTHVRQIVLNDATYDLAGQRGEDDIYMAKITGPEGTLIEDDPMRQLIQRFIDGTPPLTGRELRCNQEWLLEIRQHGASA